MSHILPPAIAAYIEAGNARNTKAFLECFTPDAVVTDEAHIHRGVEEIRQWKAQTDSAYDCTLEFIEVGVDGVETVATCRVTGNFPGSPIALRFCFTLDGGKIAALTIQP
jgi:hypothetical protein